MAIINAKLTSVWDDSVTVVTACKVDTSTKEVFDIESFNVAGAKELTKQLVTLDNGEEEFVYNADTLNEEDIGELYWYEPYYA